MLRLEPTNDKEILDQLSKTIFGKEFNRSVGFILYLGDKPIGVASLSITEEESVIERVGILPEERGKGLGDFFTRSLMNALSYSSSYVIIGYKDDYFNKFGFTARKKDMIIKSEDIFFPSDCAHNTRRDIDGSK